MGNCACRGDRALPALLVLLAGVGITAALPGPVAGGAASRPLEVVATTTIVADLARQVAGDRARVRALLVPGMDTHTYQPVPADLVAVSRADLVLVHGAGIDAWAARLVRSGGREARVAVVTEGIVPPRGQPAAAAPDEHAHGHAGEGQVEVNPHFWFDPNRVKDYVRNIEKALAAADPGGAQAYRSRAEEYAGELTQLDRWIREQVARIPPERRKLVTNHDTLEHFARAYGFQVVGTVIPSFSSEAEPSGRELAGLIRAIRKAGVDVLFTETTVAPRLAEAVAREAGRAVRVVRLYTDSLSEPGGPAGTYLDMMRYNVRTIVEALQP